MLVEKFIDKNGIFRDVKGQKKFGCILSLRQVCTAFNSGFFFYIHIQPFEEKYLTLFVFFIFGAQKTISA
jgi:hypothetical protein